VFRRRKPIVSDQAIPILMYHVIEAAVADARWPDLYVSKQVFEQHMQWLADCGYQAVTLRHVYDHWHGRGELPSRGIVVTFDDGHRSHYTNAFPVLRALGWPGVLNVTIRNQHGPAGLRPELVRSLVAAGWEIGAHTITHVDLTTVSPGRLRLEVRGSRRLLRRQFRVPVRFFCYPSGRYDAAVIEAVQAAGYLGATTTLYGLGRSSDLYELKRVRVNGSDGLSGFIAKIEALAA
jgi:peptidoglycan/xylan/chitin deacetylase (PgdA/CDA1 family)